MFLIIPEMPKTCYNQFMDKINEILTRGVEEIIDKKHLEQALRSGKKLRFKLGIDPTAKLIHIGRATVLWKLRELQDLGHKVVFIIGDFTGLIGDASDKESERPMLSESQVKENMKGYLDQVGKILNLKKTEVHANSKWLKKLGYLEIAEQADQFSLHEFEARENIAKRMKQGKRVSLREVLYPLMQGYDSVAIKADVEVGGTDQKFNLLSGRTLQRKYGQEAQDIMTFTLLEGTDGRKMSSSWGNVININDSPKEMFGKTLSLLDELIVKYFTIVTRVPLEEVKKMEKELKSGKLNPKDAKVRLGKELVTMYHGAEAAKVAAEEFERVHKNKEMPENIEEFKLYGKTLQEVLTSSGLVKSNSEARRLLEQGGVKQNGKTVKDPAAKVAKNAILQVGKRRFIKIV
jgi:tyrosyl-tRNA synthetase